jgi:parallel beta-helix repeat protein
MAPGIMLILFVTSLISSMFITRIVFAEGTIYIRPDGSVDPTTAPITRAGSAYIFTANISKPIVIEKDSIVMDGNGYTLLGSGENYGFSLDHRSNVTIRKTHIKGYNYGIHMNLSTSNTVTESFIENNVLSAVWLQSSTATSIINNTIENNYCGILLTSSENNNITSNAVKSNPFGIWIMGSSGNIVRNSTVADSDVCGIWLDQSSATIYFNNFINNTAQAAVSNSTNTWDNGYPSGGNYWSDHTGVDVKSGPNQDQPGSDGIIDTPYIIDANNKDRYPLKRPLNYGPNPDLNRDGTVNILDITIVARAFGSHQGDKNWNSTADLDNNGWINILDISIVAKYFGKKV